MCSCKEFAIIKIKQWLEKIIIELNFCPFAKKEMINQRIHYHVSDHTHIDQVLFQLGLQCDYLQKHSKIETTLIILDSGFQGFEQYLDLLAAAEKWLSDHGYDGIFQLASFHPDYYFDGQPFDDAANYTNRSPLPMLHLLREASIERVLSVYKQPEKIPEHNITLARAMGNEFFEDILKNIHNRRC